MIKINGETLYEFKELDEEIRRKIVKYLLTEDDFKYETYECLCESLSLFNKFNEYVNTVLTNVDVRTDFICDKMSIRIMEIVWNDDILTFIRDFPQLENKIFNGRDDVEEIITKELEEASVYFEKNYADNVEIKVYVFLKDKCKAKDIIEEIEKSEDIILPVIEELETNLTKILNEELEKIITKTLDDSIIIGCNYLYTKDGDFREILNKG